MSTENRFFAEQQIQTEVEKAVEGMFARRHVQPDAAGILRESHFAGILRALVAGRERGQACAPIFLGRENGDTGIGFTFTDSQIILAYENDCVEWVSLTDAMLCPHDIEDIILVNIQNRGHAKPLFTIFFNANRVGMLDLNIELLSEGEANDLCAVWEQIRERFGEDANLPIMGHKALPVGEEGNRQIQRRSLFAVSREQADEFATPSNVASSTEVIFSAGGDSIEEDLALSFRYKRFLLEALREGSSVITGTIGDIIHIRHADIGEKVSAYGGELPDTAVYIARVGSNGSFDHDALRICAKDIVQDLKRARRNECDAPTFIHLRKKEVIIDPEILDILNEAFYPVNDNDAPVIVLDD